MKGLNLFSQRQHYKPLPGRPTSPFQDHLRRFKSQLAKWTDQLPTFTTTHATLLVASTTLPAILASTDWTSPYPLPQWRRHAITHFQETSTSLGVTLPTLVSPLYTLVTSGGYHPKLTHLAMYGGTLVYHAWNLDRGFWTTLSTWMTGTVMFMGGTWMSLIVRHLLTQGLPFSTRLQPRWPRMSSSHSIYGLHGVTLHFQFALLTRYVRILLRLHRLASYSKFSPQRKALLKNVKRHYWTQMGISLLTLAPTLVTTHGRNPEVWGLLAAAVSGCISSFYHERYLSY
ncbi:hypothetical protein HMI54_001628 [Coelomomyces lativittatus]|nr:hypothetical protein HMI56_000650 [Coelomomyces lativittatus]KAJ1510386.1 hypothetical protein HMI54_001628 [Coelomomyces lativittatus]KAJ1517780.1 hypothetical protein HMI55_006021 [Coelomomyces lativittatus]